MRFAYMHDGEDAIREMHQTSFKGGILVSETAR
jgi:hypothetical protein